MSHEAGATPASIVPAAPLCAVLGCVVGLGRGRPAARPGALAQASLVVALAACSGDLVDAWIVRLFGPFRALFVRGVFAVFALGALVSLGVH